MRGDLFLTGLQVRSVGLRVFGDGQDELTTKFTKTTKRTLLHTIKLHLVLWRVFWVGRVHFGPCRRFAAGSATALKIWGK